ncbi:hypothetical protein M514_11739 [Trichuris suis]|uniref:Mos1 transposase HTH domain-containing protein n=1 Tax=Trichuris suis TaxID=68888 RepID=A0A085LQY0_9BILA|nr:hypothetical protein M513_11739 [Trichuris suis]KFD61388.1 hypothetical protein M514_11739 [Trichuris suis]
MNQTDCTKRKQQRGGPQKLYPVTITDNLLNKSAAVEVLFPAPQRTVRRWFKSLSGGDTVIEVKKDGSLYSLLENTDLKKAVEAQPETRKRELTAQLRVH